MLHRMVRALLLLLLASSSVFAQSVLGVIYGRVVDEVDGTPVLSSNVTAVRQDSSDQFHATVLKDGSYSLVRLPPGIYDVSVSAGKQYRAALVKGLDIPVGGFVR